MTSTTPTRHIIRETLDWRSIRIEIRYEPEWLGGAFGAHLEVETVDPPRAPLPITETGYRSHFTDAERIEAAGGPAAYVLAGLEEAAHDKRWKAAEIMARQYRLW